MEKTAVQRGDVDLIDEEAAKSAGAAAIGAADMNPEASMKAKKDSNVETEVIEEVVEVDNPEDAGTEVVEEVVEVDENGKVINEDKK